MNDTNIIVEAGDGIYSENTDLTRAEQKDLSRMNLILNPHKYQMDDDVFGRNHIMRLMMDPAIDIRKWPSPPKISVSMDLDSSGKAIGKFFTTMSDRMVEQYVKTCIDKGIMKTYDQVVNQSNLIDISNLYPGYEKSKTTQPMIRFSQENFDFLKSHGWYTFCPCFVSFTVRTNRKRYMHIEVLDMNEQEKSFTIRLSEYIGDKYQWIGQTTTTTTYRFDIDGENVSMSWDWSDAVMYEEMLALMIKQCKWSKQQIQLWFDMFGINYPEQMIRAIVSSPKGSICANGDEEFENSGQIPLTFKTHDDLLFAQKKFSLKSEITHKGEDAKTFMHEELISIFVQMYIRTMAAVNLKLFTEPRTDTGQTDANREVYKFRDMTVKSSVYPVVSSAHKLIKLTRKD